MSSWEPGLEAFRQAIPHAERLVPEVSGWSVGLHIQHCCLAMIGICRQLSRASMPPPRAGFNLLRLMVLLTGRIPRGRAKSPDEAVPAEEMSGTDLARLVDLAERKMDKARDLAPEAWYRHFAFSILRRDQALRVLEIHNRHHLKIIRDIIG